MSDAHNSIVTSVRTHNNTLRQPVRSAQRVHAGTKLSPNRRFPPYENMFFCIGVSLLGKSGTEHSFDTKWAQTLSRAFAERAVLSEQSNTKKLDKPRDTRRTKPFCNPKSQLFLTLWNTGVS